MHQCLLPLCNFSVSSYLSPLRPVESLAGRRVGGLPVDIRKMTPSVQARLGRSMQGVQLRMSAAEVMRAVVVLLGAEGSGSRVAARGGRGLAAASGSGEDGRVGGAGGEVAGSADGKRKRHHQGDTAADVQGRQQQQQQQGAVETSLVYCRGRTACFLMQSTGAGCSACSAAEDPAAPVDITGGSFAPSPPAAADGSRCRCCDAAVGRLASALTGSGEGRGGVAVLLGIPHPEGADARAGARTGYMGSGRLELRAFMHWGSSMDLLMCHGFREVGVGASAL